MQPRYLLRAEGAAALALALALYWAIGGSWLVFALAFLVPDAAFVAYLSGARLGAAAYNATHTHAFPLLLGVVGVVAASRVAAIVALIWIAHIGFDRVLGLGLKYTTGPRETHFGRL